MKRYLLSVLLTLATLASARADLIWYEGFNYANGSVIAVGTNIDGSTNWLRHSGSAAPSDSFVNNNKLEISATGGTPSRQDDVNRRLAAAYTNSQTVIYASFTVNCTNVAGIPAAGGYFAHHMAISGNQLGRVYAVPGTVAGTWRAGLSSAGALNKVFPVDLLTNIHYQIVVAYDPAGAFGTLWVNPTNSTDTSIQSSDSVSGTGLSAIINSFAFRQAGTFGSSFFAITNLATATIFDEAATNVWSTAPVSPVIVRFSPSGTNFLNTPSPVVFTGLVAGQGLGSLTYTWLKNGAIYPNPNGNTNSLVTAAAPESESGAYQMVATTPYGLSVTSAVANLWVTNAPVPPAISTQPASQTVPSGATVTLSVVAFGPGTVTYQWNHAGTNLPGEVGTTLLLTNVRTNNGNTGAYTVGVTNENGGVLSSVAVITATNAPKVSIAFLRTLVDGVNYNATNSSSLWEASGTVTTYTNLTTGNTASYYLQDGTAGINIFVTLGSSFRPAQGDYLNFVGVLSSFASTLELLADSANIQGSSYTVVSNNAPLPAPKVIPFGITNNLAVSEALEGRIVMLTNVYFGTNEGTTLATGANTTVTVTNAAGETFLLFFSSQDGDTAGQVLPGFAHSVVGAFTQNLGNTAVPRNQGYSVTVTRFADIVTGEPPAPVVALTHVGEKSTLTWTNVAWDNLNAAYGSNYSYSVLASTNVAGPYLPVTRYEAVLLGVNEVPANSSRAFGFGTVGVSADQTKITVNMSFEGLTANASAAHIHGPAAVGVNAGVVFGFTGVPAPTSGAIPEQTFTITPTQLGQLASGQFYMNVHNTPFSGGEIRGQIFLIPATGLTSPNTSFLNTTPTTATYLDPSAGGSQKFYRVVSP